MRTSPYPIPASRAWVGAMAAAYIALAASGLLVLALLLIVPQPASGILVLGLWGGTTLPGASACAYGVIQNRYRYEWIGAWFIVMGVSVYLVATVVGILALSVTAILSSLPTVLVFIFGILLTLGRAIQLSLVDKRARAQVISVPGRVVERWRSPSPSSPPSVS